MADLQKELCDYHDDIRLGTYDEEETLRKKRDLLINELRNSLKDEKVPDTDKALTFRKIDQGSYSMRTAIKPPNDGEYDIDVGVIFNVTADEYDARKLKKLVRDKLNKQANRTVEFNRPCVTVKYASGYHVDLPVYADNEGDIQLSWGKENSDTYDWEEADPQGLSDWVRDVSNNAEKRKQFRRCVRYLKKWKQKHFSEKGNEAPPSIGLTIQARENFIYYEDNDLAALIQICSSIMNSFYDETSLDDDEDYKSVEVILPVKPRKDVYYKMTLKQTDSFYYKIEDLVDFLESAQEDDSKHEASKYLRKAFGDFPIVEDVVETRNAPYVTTGNSA